MARSITVYKKKDIDKIQSLEEKMVCANTLSESENINDEITKLWVYNNRFGSESLVFELSKISYNLKLHLLSGIYDSQYDLNIQGNFSYSDDIQKLQYECNEILEYLEFNDSIMLINELLEILLNLKTAINLCNFDDDIIRIS